MIVFGVCGGPSERFADIAEPSIRAWGGPEFEIIVRRGAASICQAYNQILDEACAHPELEAVVLIHDDAELLGPIAPFLSEGFADQDVAILGAIGGRGDSHAMAWWSRPEKFGGVLSPGESIDRPQDWNDVDVVDGVLIAMSPWAARNLRFGEDMQGFHGYDADICSAAQAAGKRILVGPVAVAHHSTGYGSRRSYVSWMRANLTWRMKWDNGSPLSRAMLRARRLLLPIEVRLRPKTRNRIRQL